MEAFQKLIQAIATLLWPLIVILLLYLFRPAITAIIESAKSRKFTLKIGGQELTMEEANQVQQNLIADLQSQVAEIKKQVNLPQVASPAETKQVTAKQKFRSVLWVDDNPKNNSYFVQQLAKQGISVTLATSTKEGLADFASQQYDLVISDMGRQEGAAYVSDAGIALLKAIRGVNPQVPFVFFSSSSARARYGAEAMAIGANAMTSSPTELAGLLNFAS